MTIETIKKWLFHIRNISTFHDYWWNMEYAII